MAENGNGNGHNGTYTAAQFIVAIPGTAGIVSAIAKRVGCDWHTAKRYIAKYPTVQRAYDDEAEKVLDLAETKVIEAINTGDMGTARWYLSTKGKNRGYAERREITGADGNELTIRIIGGIAGTPANTTSETE
jgi:hypothetical protein